MQGAVIRTFYFVQFSEPFLPRFAGKKELGGWLIKGFTRAWPHHPALSSSSGQRQPHPCFIV